MSYLTGDPLAVRIRIAFGAAVADDPDTWEWTDVTEWWHVPDEVTITWGRSSGAGQAEHSTLSLTLKNDGRFTAYNGMSPYWPYVETWVPIAFDIDLGDGAGWRNRFSGFVQKWPLTLPGGSSRMALAKIEAVGVLARLGRGNPPARSAMYRTIRRASVAYWPMEEGSGATIAGSAFSGHAPLTVQGGTLAFADLEQLELTNGDLQFGTGRLADISGGARMSAVLAPEVIAACSGPDGWTANTWIQVQDSSTLSGPIVVMEVETPGGTYVRWQVVVDPTISPTFGTHIVAIDQDGAATTVASDSGIFTSLFGYDLSVWQESPGTIRAGLWWWHPTSSWTVTGTISGTTAPPTRVWINRSGATCTVPLPVGHLAINADHPTPFFVSQVDSNSGVGLHYGTFAGFLYEPADLRLPRLGEEDGVRIAVPTLPAGDETPRMGSQRAGTPVQLYQECETTDGGLLYEADFGLAYLPRVLRYNPEVALLLDASQGQLGLPFEPAGDDQLLRNRVTVERVGGASETAEDQDSVVRQGEIERPVTVNTPTDDGLAEIAAWWLHLSTVREPRYPSVPINLSSRRELAVSWVQCRPGSRMQVINPPRQAVPGVIDQLIVGATETFRGRRSWRAVLNVEPASPWFVFVLGDSVFGRLDTKGSALATAAAASDTELLVATTSPYRRWITTAERPDDFPLMVSVAGVPVQVTAISGTVSPQTFTLAAPLGWDMPEGIGVRISRQAVPT
ncbi:hypothetical protein ACFFMR_18845 [Micromonospora andamanensis]|uniref:Phage tail protein n=1 Tax=Micromonospora andamanensis TaxID=1287068 RepID=A0ABQ4HYM5_9ACTN|nr:hypothetical protein [Micromonospora andamanensis]GIJ10726.1 hypothetical protein Van01_39400 [Micromonospora andamanensis]